MVVIDRGGDLGLVPNVPSNSFIELPNNPIGIALDGASFWIATVATNTSNHLNFARDSAQALDARK